MNDYSDELDFPTSEVAEDTDAFDDVLDNVDIDNPSPRLPVILLLDISGSMHGSPITQLNAALKQFISETKQDKKAKRSVELEVITFNDKVEVIVPFQEMERIDENTISTLVADGQTHMGEALKRVEEDLRERRASYKQKGYAAFKPWVILMTDGAPNDSWTEPARKMKEMCMKKNFMYFGVGIGDNVRWDILKQIVSDAPGPIKLRDGCFREFFKWVTDSLTTTSNSSPDENGGIAVAEGAGTWADLIKLNKPMQ